MSMIDATITPSHRKEKEVEAEAEEVEKLKSGAAKKAVKGKRKQKLVRGQGVEAMDVDE